MSEGVFFSLFREIYWDERETYSRMREKSLWVSYTLYRSRIEVSLFLIFLRFECSIYGTVLKISWKDAWKQI